MVSFVQYLSAETAECFHSRLILMLHQQWICWPHKETVLKDSSNESVRLWKEYSGMITVDSYIHLKGYGPSVFLVKKSHFLRWICCFFCCSVLFCKVVVQLFTDIYIFGIFYIVYTFKYTIIYNLCFQLNHFVLHSNLIFWVIIIVLLLTMANWTLGTGNGTQRLDASFAQLTDIKTLVWHIISHLFNMVRSPSPDL